MLRQHLKLARRLASFDLETTGPVPVKDRIVQISITMHYPDRDPIAWQSLVNPEIPIPPSATAVHHITDEMVAGAPTFRVLAPALVKHLIDVDFCGYNIKNFDLPMLRAEMLRANVAWDWEQSDSKIIDVFRIYQTLCPRTLETAYEHFTGKKLTGAHDASVDVNATDETLIGQLQYPEVPKTVHELYEFCFPRDLNNVDRDGKIAWRDNEACINFGKKFNGVPLRDVARNYLQWMLTGEFSAETKSIVRDALAGQYPIRSTNETV